MSTNACYFFSQITQPKAVDANVFSGARRNKERFALFICVSRMLAFLSVLIPLPTTASIVFSDNTFDLADYTIESFQSGGAAISTFQTTLDGNPGAALRSLVDVPDGIRTFYTREYFMNNSFLYDPQIQGSIKTIDFMLDSYFEVDPGLPRGRVSTAILSQNGNYYVNRSIVPNIDGVWLTNSTVGLTETDFDLVTDLLTIATDSSNHPDFTSGLIQFGVVIGSSTISPGAKTYDVRRDNLSYTINLGSPIPLPGTIWLFTAGLGLSGIGYRWKQIEKI